MGEGDLLKFPAGGREGKNIQDAIDVLKSDIEKVKGEIQEAEVSLNKHRENMLRERNIAGELEAGEATIAFEHLTNLAKEHLENLKKELEQKEEELRKLLEGK